MVMRRIDDLGRIVIPRDYRQILGIAEGDALDIVIDGNTLKMRKHYDTAVDEMQGAIAKIEDEKLRDALWEAVTPIIKEANNE